MTIWNLFLAVTLALVVNDIIKRIISEVSWYFHKKKHGSIIDRLNLYKEDDDE